MKKLLLVCATFFAFQSYSQFFIDENDFGNLGDTIIYATDSNYVDDLNNLSLIGDSLEWNFSDLGSILNDTVLFENTNLFPDGDVFSNSDFAYSGLVFNTFMSVKPNEVKIDGITLALAGLIDTTILDSSIINNLPNNLAFKYKNGGLYYLDLPAQLNDDSDGTVEGAFTFFYGDSIMGFKPDSIRIKETVEYQSFVDGAGVIQLPNDDYYALKQVVNYKRSYSIDVGQIFPFVGIIWIEDVFPIPFNLNEFTYRWFGEDQEFPLVEITTDSSETVLNTRFQQAPAGNTKEEVDSILTLSTNIALDDDLKIINNDRGITITKGNNIVGLSVYNITGELIFSKPSMNNNYLDIELRNSGMFFVKYENNKGVIKSRKIVH